MSLVDAAAWACLLGVGGLALLSCDDDFERTVRLRVVERAVALDQDRARNWAIAFANALIHQRVFQ